ncbi:MAG: dihydroorotase, partial [Propionibacteriaceae bacterium]|nr:dihydroorotase [Propionibacteriaceae bacterium]
MTDRLIKNLRLPDGTHADLGIAGGCLVEPASLIHPAVIEADGLIALPGLVDLHTHLREPSPTPAETIASGTAAAARGGYTAVFAMANTNPVTDTADRVKELRRRSLSASAEVIPVGAITYGLAGLELADLEAIHAEGVTHFSDDGYCLMDSTLMRAALTRVGAFGGLIAPHSPRHRLAGPAAGCPARPGSDCAVGSASRHAGEHSPNSPRNAWVGAETDWPGVAEAAMVARDVQLARDTGAHVHICHVSMAESVEVIRWAKKRGIPVSAEVTPHHLLLDAELLTSGDTRFKVNPPLRHLEDRLALRQALADGTIDVVATDHAPHLPADKNKPLAEAKPGMVGLEWALAVVIETLVLPGLMDWVGV